MKVPDQRVGLMHCFCLSKFTEDPIKFLDIEFKSLNATDTTEHCDEWLTNFGF